MFQSKYQLNGTKSHETIDKNKYSTSSDKITSLEVYSEKFRIIGKIDIYDKKKELLVERKKHIKEIYDGYVFQLYAQYYCMTEMGYNVSKLQIRSCDDNKIYKIKLPDEDKSMKEKFENTGGKFYYVELKADLETRLEHNLTPHRLEQKPSKRDTEWTVKDIYKTMEKYRLNSNEGEIKFENYLRINNTNLSPDEVSNMIIEKFKLL